MRNKNIVNIISNYWWVIAIIFLISLIFGPKLLLCGGFNRLSLGETDINVASNINNLTTPIIGFFSVIFLFLAFKSQHYFSLQQSSTTIINNCHTLIISQINSIEDLNYNFLLNGKPFSYKGFEALSQLNSGLNSSLDTGVNIMSEKYHPIPNNLSLILFKSSSIFLSLEIILKKLDQLPSEFKSEKKLYANIILNKFMIFYTKTLDGNREVFSDFKNEINTYLNSRNSFLKTLKEVHLKYNQTPII